MTADARTRRLRHGLVLGLILLAAAGLRLVNLGYAEFQGDEARAMLLASRLIESRDPATLLWHKKGPLEVLLPAIPLRIGDLRESAARLPFALAGLGVVLAGYVLGRRLFGRRAGLLAAGILAIDGYLVAFSRIVQYQSLVALSSVMAVWAAWRWYTARRGGGNFLVLAGLCLGLGTWAHYEAVFAALPVAYLALRRGRREHWLVRQWLRQLTPPLLVAVGVAAAFYIPFALHPQFSETLRYITERRVGGGGPYNMLPDFFQRASFYNASYYVIVMLLGLLASVLMLVDRAVQSRLPRARLVIVAVLALAAVMVVAMPQLFEVAGRSWAMLVFLLLFAIPLASGRIGVRWKLLLVWLAGPFLVASFLVLKPHTHFYTMVTPWALLIAGSADRLLRNWSHGRWARPVRITASVAAAVFVLLCGWYLVRVFVRHDPEYKRVFPEAALPGYWLPYGDDAPRGGYFGFPYRAGWNEVRALFADGTLQGSYDSNEESLITGWYTGGAVRCPEDPRYYLVAWRPQDEETIPDRAELERTHFLKATIRVDGQEKLWIYDREPVVGTPLVIDDSGGLLAMGGDASSFVDRALPVSQALEWPLVQWPTDARFDDRLRLLGADVAGLAPGHDGSPPNLPRGIDNLGVVLAWEPDAPLERDYEVGLYVQGPSAMGPPLMERPACGTGNTTTWQMGERVFDGHNVPLYREIMEPGDYVLGLILMDRTNERPADLRQPGQDVATRQVPLTTFRVEAP